jgi:gamma-glutamyltranspeptidase/glutathione hydrolase
LAGGDCVALDFRETAPAAASRDMYLDPRGEVIPRASTLGPRSAGVPGTVAGLCMARERWGTMTLPELVAPAIRLAREGVPVSYALYRAIAETDSGEALADFRRFPSSARVFLRGGEPLVPGDTMRQPDLARTLERIARHGPTAFYRGPIAKQLVAAMERDGGLITAEDLAAYRPVVREPLVGEYRGLKVYTMPPPSSGGIILLGLLRALEPESLRAMGHNSAAFVHRFVETCNRYYADRARWLGDPDFVQVPAAGLASRAYAARVRAAVDTARHTPGRDVAPGDSAWLWSSARDESPETTHFSVVDARGNAVSATYTLNDAFGSRYVVEGAGFLINDEMDDFSARAGAPNLYGLVGGTANAIEPGKRMLSSMTPTLVTREGEPYLVLGSPGGGRIITAVCQALLNLVDHGMNVQDAVAAPRVHSQWLPDKLWLEPLGFPRELEAALAARGHVVDMRFGFWGEVHAVEVDPRRGLLFGGADPRGANAAAVGY